MFRRTSTAGAVGLGCLLLTVISCGSGQSELERTAFLAERGWSPAALNEPVIAWRTTVGMGHSAVVVSGDRLYTMGNERRAGVHEDVVSCLAVETGAVIWQHRYPCDDIYFPGPRSTPLLDGERLYTLSWQGHLRCLDAGDGSLLWSRHLVEDGLTEVPHWGISSSPVIADELLIVTAGRAGAAFDKLTGELRWQSQPGEPGLPTPLLLDSGGHQLAGFLHEAELLAVDTGSGELQWTLSWDDMACLPPAQVGDRLLIPGTRGSALYALAGGKPELLWQSGQARLSEFRSWGISGDHLYGFDRSYLQCIDLATGKRCWRTRIGDNGALSIADGMLLISTDRGELVIAEATAETYRELSRAKVLTIKSNRGVPQPKQHHCWTHPVLADGRVYVRCNHGNLVSIDLR